MTYAPSEPFAEEELLFVPLDGAFDVEAVTRFMRALDFTFQDPQDPRVFVTCDSAESAASLLEQRAATSDGNRPLVMFTRVAPAEVVVSAWAGEEYYPKARRLAIMLLDQRRCRVVNGMGTDLTKAVVGSVRL